MESVKDVFFPFKMRAIIKSVVTKAREEVFKCQEEARKSR